MGGLSRTDGLLKPTRSMSGQVIIYQVQVNCLYVLPTEQELIPEY